MWNGYGHFERLQDFVVSPEFLESLCLFTKNGGNGLDGVTALELFGEWVPVCQTVQTASAWTMLSPSAFHSPSMQPQRAPVDGTILIGHSCQ
jgi:hypothetical protein